MPVTAPKIDDRTWQQIVDRTLALAPFYTPEWTAFLQDKESGNALVKLFAHMLEAVIARLNKMPDKNFIAFLDMLGIKALPARSSLAPVTFTLTEGTKNNVFIPARTQVAAPPTTAHEELIFITEKDLLATYAKLLKVVSTNPADDAIYAHPAEFSERTRFEVFTGNSIQEHVLYIAHNDLFNIKAAAKFQLKLALAKATESIESQNIEWQYWDGEYWIPLFIQASADQADILSFRKSGELKLEKKCEGEIKEGEIDGVKNRWLRCRLVTPIAPEAATDLPVIDTVEARIEPDQFLLPDLAFSQDVPVDVKISELVETISVEMQGIDIGKLTFLADPDPNSNQFPQRGDTSARLNDVSNLEKGQLDKKGDRLEFKNSKGETDQIDVIDIKESGLSSPITEAHFYNAPAGQNGNTVRRLEFNNQGVASGIWKSIDLEPLTLEYMNALLAGNIYVNIHTENHPAGEIRGQLDKSPADLQSILNRDQVVETDYGSGTGTFKLTSETITGGEINILTFTIDLTNVELSGDIKTAKFHVGFAGETGGEVRDFTLSFAGKKAENVTWKSNDANQPLTEELIESLRIDEVYVNITTDAYPDGEIRGQVISSDQNNFTTTMDRAQVFPAPQPGTGNGRGTFLLNATTKELRFEINVSGANLSGKILTAAFHNATTSSIGLEERKITESFVDGIVKGTWVMADEQITKLLAGNIYVQIATPRYHKGEIRGQVTPKGTIIFTTELMGANEVPAVETKGKGSGTFTLNIENVELQYNIRIDDYDSETGEVFRITWGEGLKYDYDANSSVRLITAIRPLSQNEKISVKVANSEAIEKLKEKHADLTERKEEMPVHLIRNSGDIFEDDPTGFKLIEIDTHNNILKIEVERNTGLPNPYYEKDVVEFREFISDIYPFGQDPRLFSTFYIASQEAFSKKGAKITISFEADLEGKPAKPDARPQVSWEYWNGTGWQFLKVEDGTKHFTHADPDQEVMVIFDIPYDLEVTTVSGQKNFWIRARLVAGDYGKRIYFENNALQTGNIAPPIISFNYLKYELPFKPLEKCLTFNNRTFENYSDAVRFQGQLFSPFQALDHQQQSLYLGFDNPLISGPINLFFSLVEQAIPESAKPKFAWTYWDGKNWATLNKVDYTEGFTRSEFLAINGPSDFAKRKLFGETLFWLRGSLVEGKFESTLEIKGIFPNTAWATQAGRIESEILGSSNATRSQEFVFLRTPVVSQEIWVKEPNAPSEEEQAVILSEEGDGAIIEKKNTQGDTTEIRIRWHEVEDFFNSKPTSRHYIIVDRARGVIRFGDGERGMIPPAGTNNIIADYLFGGGRAGNIEAAEISSLKSAVPFVKAATNYAPAGGGADMESRDETLRRGPQSIRNRNRAVTAEDYEWLTREASQFVARVKCLPNRNNVGQFEAGWVTVIIVPDSKDERPQPNPQMLTTVANYLGQRCVNSVFAPRHLHVTGPIYVEVGAIAEIVPVTVDMIATAEGKALETLKTFFHPLTGGAEGRGWEFGRKICIAEVFALLENIREIDYVKHLVLVVDGITTGADVEIDPHALVVSGEHKIRSVLASDFQSMSEHPCAKTMPCEEV